MEVQQECINTVSGPCRSGQRSAPLLARTASDHRPRRALPAALTALEPPPRATRLAAAAVTELWRKSDEIRQASGTRGSVGLRVDDLLHFRARV
jgi:hypothetical protein